MIHWDMILEGEHKEALLLLYGETPLEELSERLGVSKIALRAKILKEGIPLRPKGGVNPMTRLGKSRLDCLDPAMFKQLTPREIAKRFDMCIPAVYKYIHKHKLEFRRARESVSRQGDNIQADELQSSGDVGDREVANGTSRNDEVHKDDIAAAAGHASGLHSEGARGEGDTDG